MDSATPPRRSPLPSPGSRGPAVTGVLLVMAALTVGWPLIDQSLGNDERLRDGTVLRLGPGDDTVALRVVGGGWLLRKSESDPDRSYALTRGGVDLVAGHINLLERAVPGELWSGQRKVQSAADEDSRLGTPRPVISDTGAVGEAGTLSRDGRTGSAVVWEAPGGGYAVAITVLARPGADPRAAADATAVARSASFPGEPL